MKRVKKVIKEQTDLTEEDIINSYDFKIACSMIQNEFPWITDCILDTENFKKTNYKTNIWVDYVINPFELMREKGWKFNGFIPVLYHEDEIVFTKKDLAVIFDISYDDSYRIKLKINKIYSDIRDTKVIPQEFKIPEERIFQCGDFIIPPGYDLTKFM